MAGGGQFALGSGFLEELVGLVAVGFGVGEDGGERGPGRVGEDSLGVVGDCCSYVAGQNAAGFFPGRAGCEFGERRGEGAVGGCLEVLDGLAGGVGLVGVERILHWKRTGEKPSPVMVWTPEHIGFFLDHVAEDRLYALFHLIAFRGLRRGEACGQKWADTSLDAGLITVAKQLVVNG